MSSPMAAEARWTPGFQVRLIGPVARRLLSQTTEGNVVAVFRSAFYIETAQGLFCIGTDVLEPGPITLLTAAPRAVDWCAFGLALRERAAISSSVVQVGDRLRFTLGGATDWLPARIVEPLVPAAAARGHAALRDASVSRRAVEGLGGFIDPDYAPAPKQRDAVAAAGAIACARDWLAAALDGSDTVRHHTSGWARNLIGLGPGLTPSGDDFLGGMMLALHALEREDLASTVWDGIQPGLAQQTNGISATLLAAASDGLGSATVHDVLAAILRGNPDVVHAAIPALDGIGHTSGWDAMAGIATVLAAWLGARRKNLGAASAASADVSNRIRPDQISCDLPGRADISLTRASILFSEVDE